jgi:hypothetical protein
MVAVASGRTKRILERKRNYGQRVLTFAEVRSSEHLRTLYFVEKQLGAKAIAGLTRLSTINRVSEIMADVLLSNATSK